MTQESEQPRGEVVIATPTTQYRPANLLPMNVEQLHNNPAVYTTLTLNTPEARARLYDMVVEGGENAKEYINKEFAIDAITVHPVTISDKETGEMFALARVILQTKDGDTIQFVSKGIWACLVMAKDCGFEPFGPVPQRWILKAVPLEGGRQMYKLLRAKETPQPKKK